MEGTGWGLPGGRGRCSGQEQEVERRATETGYILVQSYVLYGKLLLATGIVLFDTIPFKF